MCWLLMQGCIAIRRERAQQGVVLVLRTCGEWQWGEQTGSQWHLRYWLPVAVQLQLVDVHDRPQRRWLTKDAVTEEAWRALRLCCDEWRAITVQGGRKFRPESVDTSAKYVRRLEKTD